MFWVLSAEHPFNAQQVLDGHVGNTKLGGSMWITFFVQMVGYEWSANS